jgi:hypothetical protein
MTTTQHTILACMEMNVGAAKTQALRDHAAQQLQHFRERMIREHKKHNTAFERFLDKITTDTP